MGGGAAAVVVVAVLLLFLYGQQLPSPSRSVGIIQ
jgi:hypothetical protein